MWIERKIGGRLLELLHHFPAVILTGPRQSGKTSLLQRLLPGWRFVSLDLPSLAEEAEKRPLQFLEKFPPPVIVDEVQYAPGLFRHLKVAIDADRTLNGRFILTGSQKFQLMSAVSDSLAGRCAILELHTLSAAELEAARRPDSAGWLDFILRGGFPELCAEPGLPAADFFRAYISTYLERDVRNLLQVGNLRDFERFIRVTAIRSGSLLNLSDIARDVGIAPSTARHWLSVLEASGIVLLVEPYFNNLGKRIVKTPKSYVMDTGLLCHLLGISSVSTLLESPFLGSIWESFVCGQIARELQLKPTAASLWFWRDAHGLEVDFLLDVGSRFELVECKWTENPGKDDAAPMGKLRAVLEKNRPVRCRVACRASNSFPLAENVEAVNGFLEREWVREG